MMGTGDPSDIIRAVKEDPEIQALLNSLKTNSVSENVTPRRPYSQQPQSYSNLQYNPQPNQASCQSNFQISPNYRGNCPRPQHEVYQRHSHRQGYSPSYSPGGGAPRATSPNNNWQPPHHPRQNTLRQIDLMITYVVNATTFWAQILCGDIVNTSLKLEESLKKECPTLPPVQKVGKGHVYGTLWDGGWYRCITCGPPDPDDIVDIMFVDYGNKERKHMNELVWLSAPAFTTVPFLATPFVLPGLSPVTDFAEQAISLFSTNEALQGYVTCVPKVEEFCSIKLLRPAGDQNEPKLRDYNSLLLHKGYVKSSTETPGPPPTYHYISGLQQRLQYMSQLLREKEHTITNLGKELQRSRDMPELQSSRDHPRDIRELDHSRDMQELDDIETEIVPEIPAMVLESMPRAPRTVSEISVPDHITESEKEDEEQSSEEVEIISETLHQESPSSGQDLFISLFNEAEQYKALMSNSELESELVKLLKYRRVLADNVLPEEVTQNRASVREGEKRLACAQEEIRNCQRKNLQSLTELRDEDVASLTASIQSYTDSVKACNGEQLLSNVENIMLELGDCAMSSDEFKTVAEAFEVLSKVCSKYTERKNQCKKDVTELLTPLCNNWQLELQILQRVNCIAGLEQEEWTAPDPDTVVEETFSLTQQLLNAFHTYKTILSQEIAEKTPLSFSIKSILLIQAKSQYKQLKPIFGCLTELEQRAATLSTFITDKPDITILTTLKKDIKAARRIVKLAQIEASSDDEDDDNSESTLHAAMLSLHDLYLQEEANLVDISTQAQGPYPELLINHPQLRNIISGEDIIKAGWELSHFVMPNNCMAINSLKQRVLEGIYRDEVAFFVEYTLQNTEETLEEEAIRLIKDNLEGCFAIFIDSKCSRAYGCTKTPPI